MKKMNNKGFAISSLLYGLLLVAFLIVAVLMSVMASNRKNTTSLIDKIDEELSRHSNTIVEFSYTGDVQEFIVPYGKAGWYKIELWGAGGKDANSEYKENRGSYTSGVIKLVENQHLYFYVGGTGISSGRAFNQINSTQNKGGGATDVRTVSGGSSYDETTSKNSIIMLAGGGQKGGKYQGLDTDGYNAGASFISGYNGQNVVGDANFVGANMFPAINKDDGKAKIELVSQEDNLTSTAIVSGVTPIPTGNYYLSVSEADGLLMSATTSDSDKNPTKLMFYEGLKKQRWTINAVDGNTYKIIETENNYALQPKQSDSDGKIEEDTPVSTLGTYTGNIWEKWQIVPGSPPDRTGYYMIKLASSPNYCLTVVDIGQNAPIRLNTCNEDEYNPNQFFKLTNAEY